ncbi:hypothetical protein Taro_018798 [Colocasia esculenta]|uniref:RNase H type-1 domain-containing protein n=1 Tax=Colocasia esculenta TaxID=4460 RepID=A0A843V3J5_COLES|nr:hypothetical protein [Colocasia esculenta]
MWNSFENVWMEFKLRLDCFGLMEKVESTTIYLQYCRINRSFGLCTADLKQSSNNSFLLDLALGWILGNGASIRFLDDVWIGQKPLRNNLQTPLSDPSTSVREVMLDDSHHLSSLIDADLDQLQLTTAEDTRCKMKFEQVHISLTSMRYNIQECLSIAIDRMAFKCNSTSKEMDTIRDLGLFDIVPVKMSKYVRWIPPVHGLMLNVDGASKGNPGPCGGGGIFRDSHGNATLAFSHYYGVGSCMVAEVHAMHDGILLAVEKGLMVTDICSDSLSLVTSLRTGVVPSWDCYKWWRNVLDFVHLHGVNVTHVFREANKAADALANYACSMRCNEKCYCGLQKFE